MRLQPSTMRILIAACGVVFVGLAATTAADLKHPDWHPSGDYLISEGSCLGSIDLYVIDLAGQSVRQVWDGGHTEGYPRWFPDGESIVFHQIDERRDARLMTARLSPGSELLAAEHLTEGPFDIEPAPSPDGRLLAFSQPGSGGQDIAVLDLTGNAGLRVWRTEEAENFPSWHPNGRALIFHSSGSQGTQIQLRDLASDELRWLTEGPGPNLVGHLGVAGNLLAFSSERDGDREIYLKSLERSTEERLTRRPGRDGYPKISPDGSRIAYHAVVGEHTEVRVLDLETGDLTLFDCE